MAARNTVSQLKIVIPRGRSAAEQRLAAIAALHQPMYDKYGIYRHPTTRSNTPSSESSSIGPASGDPTRSPNPC
jgi:hypothetical protein